MSIRSQLDFKPIVLARRSALLSLTNNTVQTLSYDVEVLDFYNTWNGSVFTTPSTGTYCLEVNSYFSSTAGTVTAVDFFHVLLVNGSSSISSRFGNRLIYAGSIANCHLTAAIPALSLTAGDTVSVQASVSFTGSTAVSVPSGTYTSLAISCLT